MGRSVNQVLMAIFDLSENEIVQNLTKEKVAKWDSLTHMDLVSTLEMEFDIQLEVNDMIEMDSLDKIRAIVQSVKGRAK